MSDIDSTADSLAEGAQQDAIDAAVAAGDMARAAVSWGSPGEPIMPALYGPGGGAINAQASPGPGRRVDAAGGADDQGESVGAGLAGLETRWLCRYCSELL